MCKNSVKMSKFQLFGFNEAVEIDVSYENGTYFINCLLLMTGRRSVKNCCFYDFEILMKFPIFTNF